MNGIDYPCVCSHPSSEHNWNMGYCRCEHASCACVDFAVLVGSWEIVEAWRAFDATDTPATLSVLFYALSRYSDQLPPDTETPA